AVGSVSSFAAVYEDPAGDAFERFVDRATSCSEKHVQRLLEKPAELLKGISAEDLFPKERALLQLFLLAEMRVKEIRLPPLGDESRAYGFAVGRSLGPVGPELSPVQVAFIRKGRTVAFLFFSSIGGLTDDFVVELSEKVASRM
nr:hypothetical protein [Actinomycetota bacterium]